ncbi:MAG: hypothetical protein DI498_15080 [Paracoccus denitrificans]|nr:MAG: hypothetical protein DI498_15080 [Paracoccus denitrificans]PZO82298.1 MAG: hypothetical protein DI633_15080 [Paracoccus denitrificans]
MIITRLAAAGIGWWLLASLGAPTGIAFVVAAASCLLLPPLAASRPEGDRRVAAPRGSRGRGGSETPAAGSGDGDGGAFEGTGTSCPGSSHACSWSGDGGGDGGGGGD